MTTGCDFCSQTGFQADGVSPCPCQEIPLAKGELAGIEQRLTILEKRLGTLGAFQYAFTGMVLGVLLNIAVRNMFP